MFGDVRSRVEDFLGESLYEDDDMHSELEKLVDVLSADNTSDEERIMAAHNPALISKWATMPMSPAVLDFIIELASIPENADTLCTEMVLSRVNDAATHADANIRNFAFAAFVNLAKSMHTTIMMPYVYALGLEVVMRDFELARINVLKMFMNMSRDPEVRTHMLNDETFMNTMIALEREFQHSPIRSWVERVLAIVCCTQSTRMQYLNDERIMEVATRPRVGVPYMLLTIISHAPEAAQAMIPQPRVVRCAVAGNNNTTLAERLVATVTENNALAILQALDAPLTLQLSEACAKHQAQRNILRRYATNRQILRGAEAFSTARDHSGRRTLGFLPSLLFSFLAERAPPPPPVPPLAPPAPLPPAQLNPQQLANLDLQQLMALPLPHALPPHMVVPPQPHPAVVQDADAEDDAEDDEAVAAAAAEALEWADDSRVLLQGV